MHKGSINQIVMIKTNLKVPITGSKKPVLQIIKSTQLILKLGGLKIWRKKINISTQYFDVLT